MTTNRLFLYFGLTGVGLSLISGVAIAQTDVIPEIVVTAKSNQSLAEVLPTSHILTAADIDAAQAKDIPALLDQITGINVNDSGGRGSVTGVFLRGTSSAQTIVLIDGVRVGSATLGAAALNSYPIEAIERIEVVKGPLSGIYGADAVGGVIQLFTKKGGLNRGSVTATVGSDALQEYGLVLNGGNHKNSFRISAHSEQTDGIDRTSIVSGGNDDRDGFEETAISIGGKVTLNENTIANLSLLYSDGTVEFDNTFGADPGLMTDTRTLSSALNLRTQLNDRLIWTTTLGLNEDNTTTNGDFPSNFITNRDSIGTELQIELTEDSLFTLGADYYQEDIESSNDFPVSERDNSGIFALLQTTAGSFGLVGNLRFDDNSAYGSETNSSIALNYNFNDRTRAVMSYGTAFVAPSFNFLYFPFFGNPELKPEESESFELSLLGRNDGFEWRLSTYRTEVENLFSFDPATFLAANVGEAELKGVEFELSTQFSAWDLGLNLDLLSAKNSQSGVELDDRPEQVLALTASRSIGKLNLRFDLKAEHGRYDNSGAELSGYGLLDVSAKYTINDNFSVLAQIENLFDKDYTVNLIGATDRYNTEGIQSKMTVHYQF